MQLTNVTDVLALTRQMIDIPSVSDQEGPLADAVESALRDAGFGSVPPLQILRDGDAVLARTQLGLGQRVVLAGHLDTVPIADNVPGRTEERDGVEVLWGRGSVDMLGGCAAALALACEAGKAVRGGAFSALTSDVTWIFYDHEEVAAHLNGLGRVQRNHPDWLAGDLALLGEPTAGHVEGGCNGTRRSIFVAQTAQSVGFDGGVFAGSVESTARPRFVKPPGWQGGSRIAVTSRDSLSSFEGADDEFVGVIGLCHDAGIVRARRGVGKMCAVSHVQPLR